MSFLRPNTKQHLKVGTHL